MDDDHLQGVNAIVTGGARGLGRSFALRLAERGANVAVVDVDLSSHAEYEREQERMTASNVQEEIRDRSVEALGIEADVTDPDRMDAMAETVADEFGSIDVLVANAGGGVGSPEETRASELSLDHLHATVERNLYGTIYTCLSVAPYMKREGSGKIITLASQAGREASENGSYAHYGAAKAGIITYTKYLAQDLGEHGINVNSIAPGFITTGRLMESFERIGIDEVERGVALGRLGDPTDCADVVEFLASSSSDYVTGAVVPVDGGSVRS